MRQGQLLGLLDPVDLPQRLSAARAALQASRQQSAAAAAQWRQTQATLTYVASNTARRRYRLQTTSRQEASP